MTYLAVGNQFIELGNPAQLVEEVKSPAHAVIQKGLVASFAPFESVGRLQAVLQITRKFEGWIR